MIGATMTMRQPRHSEADADPMMHHARAAAEEACETRVQLAA